MPPEESSEYVRCWRIGLSSLCFLAFSPSIAHRVDNACWPKDGWPDWTPLLTSSPQRCYECPKPSAAGPGTPTPIRMALNNVFTEKCICRQLSSNNYSSFELNIFELGRFESVFCAVIYRPPKYNKDFINDFSNCLSGIVHQVNFRDLVSTVWTKIP